MKTCLSCCSLQPSPEGPELESVGVFLNRPRCDTSIRPLAAASLGRYGLYSLHMCKFHLLTIVLVCDRLCENVSFRAKKSKGDTAQKYLLMDFLIINSLLTLDIALSIRQVSAHFTCCFIPGERSENFTYLVGFSDLYVNVHVVWRVCRK